MNYYNCLKPKRVERKKRIENIKIGILSFFLLSAIITSILQIPRVLKMVSNEPEKEYIAQIPVVEDKIAPMPQILTKKGVVAEKSREVSAYNAGDRNQTDNSPCIGASGVDICNLLDHGICVFAANFVPLGTYLNIDGIGECQVLDRMNKKYPNRVDIAMPLSEKKKALEFGVQNINVRVLKN